jgi:hypothetical protein
LTIDDRPRCPTARQQRPVTIDDDRHLQAGHQVFLTDREWTETPKRSTDLRRGGDLVFETRRPERQP